MIGSQLAAAFDPEVSIRKILSEADAVRSKGSSQYFTNAVTRLPEMFGKALNGVGDSAANRAEVGDYALRAPTEREEVYVSRMAAQLELASGRREALAVWLSTSWTAASRCWIAIVEYH
jgi:hypothetical protein